MTYDYGENYYNQHMLVPLEKKRNLVSILSAKNKSWQ